VSTAVAGAREAQLQLDGIALANADVAGVVCWLERLAGLKSPEERKVMRTAYVGAFAPKVRTLSPKFADYTDEQSEEKARKRFDDQARFWAPIETSRKAESIKAKRKAGGGRKEKTVGKAHAVDARTLAAWISVALGRIGSAQLIVTDPAMVHLLGEIAADLHGKSPEARKAANAKPAKAKRK
jgi:hypothetical protein